MFWLIGSVLGYFALKGHVAQAKQRKLDGNQSGQFSPTASAKVDPPPGAPTDAHGFALEPFGRSDVPLFHEMQTSRIAAGIPASSFNGPSQVLLVRPFARFREMNELPGIIGVANILSKG